MLFSADCRLVDSSYCRAVLKKKSPNCKNRQSKKIFWLLTKFGKKNADLYKSAFFVKRGNYRL